MANEITTSGKNILVRAQITDEEWAAIRKEAIDRDMYVSHYIALLLRAGRECVPPLQPKEATE